MLDKSELLVGEKLWNFFADEDIYDDLLGAFKEVGDEMKDSINEITDIRKKKYIYRSMN